MTLELSFQIAFAVAAAAVIGSVALVVAWRLPRAVLIGAGVAMAAASAGAWAAYGFTPGADLAVAAGGLTLCAAIELASLMLDRLVARRRMIEQELEHAEDRISKIIAEEADQRASEVQRALARARADVKSAIADEGRALVAQRESAFAARERQQAQELTDALSALQQRVEGRLSVLAADLEKAQHSLEAELVRLTERQGRLLADFELRLSDEAKALQAASDEQRAGIAQLRQELTHSAEEAASSTSSELEEHAAQRRQALHEVSERLRRRERELREQIEREQVEASRRITSDFGDVERRHVEALERAVARAAERYSEAAEQQFAAAIKIAREDAAQRLARELDRAATMFAREAQSVLAERLAQVGTAGEQRLERGFTRVSAGLERRHDELLSGLESRVTGVEGDLRRRLDALAGDIATEQSALEARTQELSRRADELIGVLEERLAGALHSG